MRKIAPITVIFTLLSAIAVAQPVAVTGPGLDSCGEWTRERQQRSNQAVVSGAWVLGVIVGVRMAEKQNWGRGIAHEGYFGWIDNYCRANPLDLLATATFRLLDELRKR